MMSAAGERVILYGPDRADDIGDVEHVVITTKADRKRWGFGEHYDTAATPFSWDPGAPHWLQANKLTADAVRDRADDRDILCLTTSAQAVVAALNEQLTVAEWAVGYEGIYTRDRWFCAFESHAWRHHVYGLNAGWADKDGRSADSLRWRAGRAFDTVIPNFFDPDEFELAHKHDWLLYLGRVIDRKGIREAVEISRVTGRKLIVAGPGGSQPERGKLVTAEGTELAGDIDYLGEVGPAERRYLLGRAAALLVPTVYIEPFGGVAIEAMLSGTPVVASDWGAFTETVTPDVGARFATLAQAEVALEHALILEPERIREAAIDRFSLEAVGPLFTSWFNSLDSLWREGWYERTEVAA